MPIILNGEVVGAVGIAAGWPLGIDNADTRCAYVPGVSFDKPTVP